MDATYDNLASRPLGLPAEENAVPNPYMELNYTSFNVVDLLGPNSLLIPHTALNAIVGGAVTEATGNGASPSILAPPGYVFSPLSTYLSCDATSAGGARAPVGCTLQFTATKASGGTVTALLSFLPDTILGNGSVSLTQSANMQQGVFPASFASITGATIAVVDSSVETTATTFELDDPVYEVWAL
ncbi:hypothetical protein MMC13_004509 [Lambiella insularis]|nr:hypothetical protein [Lambiella insularis]